MILHKIWLWHIISQDGYDLQRKVFECHDFRSSVLVKRSYDLDHETNKDISNWKIMM